MSNDTPSKTQPAQPSALVAYKQRALEALIEMAKTSSMRHSRAADYVSSLGLPSAIFADEGGYQVPNVEESEYVNGQLRADLTPTAIAKHEAKELKDFRQQTYRLITRAVSYDTPEDVAVKALEALDLPAPKTTTSVSVTYQVTPDSDEQHVSFTLPGEVKEDDIRAKFASLVNVSAKQQIAGLFANAENVSASDGIDSLYVRTHRVWAEVREIS